MGYTLMSGLAFLFILVANSAPILIRSLPLFEKFTQPLDCHLRFMDGRRLLGDTKTWRGMLAAIILTSVVSALLQTGWLTGAVVGLLAMLGDSLSSFSKRRFGMAPSAMAIGIDQIPESLLPLIYLHYSWQLGWLRVCLLVLVFIILELALSRLLYRMHIRKRPY